MEPTSTVISNANMPPSITDAWKCDCTSGVQWVFCVKNERSSDDGDETDNEEGFDDKGMRANRNANGVKQLNQHEHEQKPVDKLKDCRSTIQVPYAVCEQMERADDAENGGGTQQDSEDHVNGSFHVAEEGVRTGLAILDHGSG
jgi:hypothetical protein